MESNDLDEIPSPIWLFTGGVAGTINTIFHTHCDTKTTQTLKKRGYTVSKTAHIVVANEEIPATCLEAGSHGGTHCSVCETVITPAKYLPPTGHNPVTDPAIAPTYTTTGLTEGVHCANCGAVITPQQVVPMLEPEPTVAPSYDPSADPDSPAPSEPVVATGISLNRAGTVTLETGKALQLRGIVDPYNADTTLTWSSGNPNVAVVDRTGRVIAVGAGTAAITVSTDNGLTASVTISVPKTGSSVTPTPAPDGISLNKKNLTLKKGKTAQLTVTFSPKTASSTLTWKSSNKKVATVSKTGKVKAVGKGTATITVKTTNGLKATAKITVKVEPKTVTLYKGSKKLKNGASLTLKKGKTLQLKAKIPSGTMTTLTWSSDKKKIAKVSKSGKVTALKKGAATITVKTAKDVTAAVKIIVE